jgi:anti-sigma factor RsiW
METKMTNSAAITAAKMKREKKAAAMKARIDGKIAAAERRELEEQEFRDMADKEHQALQEKIAAVRKAMGVRKNEETPASLRRLISQWESEMMLRFWEHRRAAATN